MGHIVLCGSTKGGPGKTTAATTLSVMRAQAGHRVLLVDTDKQESATMWHRVRQEDEVQPAVVSVIKRGRIGEDLLALRDSFDTVVVDAGGHDSTELRQCLAIADFILSPLRPTQFDTWSLAQLAKLVREVRDLTGVEVTPHILLNQASTHPQSTEVADAAAALEPFQDVLRLMQGHVKTRMAYQRAGAGGMAVTELTGRAYNAEAVAEMQNVYNQVFGGLA